MIGVVRVICVALGVWCLAAAVTVALVPLPDPAAGGTCGPGVKSESPIAAFFDPGSIGAGPYPSAASGQRASWRAFVSECQSATDTRMEVALAILAGSLLLALGLPFGVRRFAVENRSDDSDGAGPAGRPPPPGWYPDHDDAQTARWWDGRSWGPPVRWSGSSSPSGGPPSAATAAPPGDGGTDDE